MKLLTASIALASAVLAAEPRAHAEVRVLVPQFEATTETLGVNLAKMFSIEVAKSFKKSATPRPRSVSFSAAEIGWSKIPLPKYSAESADAVAIGLKYQLILWGSVLKYGSGQIVQAQLSMPDVTALFGHFGKWSVNPNRFLLMELGLPDRDYVFSAIPVTPDAAEFLSAANRFVVCPEKQAPCEGASLGVHLSSASEDGEYALVHASRSDEPEGWVHLPKFVGNGSAAVAFTSAMVRYTAGDFERAAKLFLAAYDADRNAVIRFQSLVLAGISLTRAGGDGSPHLRTALRLNPYSRYAVQALFMSNLVVSQVNEKRRGELLLEADRLLEAYRHLFEPGDAWLLAADSAIEEATKKGESSGSNLSAQGKSLPGSAYRFVDLTNVASTVEQTFVVNTILTRAIVHQESSATAWRNSILNKLEKTSLPSLLPQSQGEDSIQIAFIVGADGRVSNLRVVQSSNEPKVDLAVLRAIRQAQPFPPPPRDLSNPFMVVGMRR